MLKAVGRSLYQRIAGRIVCLILLLFAATAARAQSTTGPKTGEVVFTVFVGSVPVGVERVGVSRTETGWLVTSTGQSGPPIDLDIRSFEAEYDDAWQPRRLAIDSTRNSRLYAVETTFTDGLATNLVQQGDDRVNSSTSVSASTVVLPDFFFGAYEALAVRLSESREGDEIPVYVAPRREITAVVRGVRRQQIKTSQSELSALIYETVFRYDARVLEGEVWVDQNRRLLRVNLPGVQLDVARQDLSLVSTRLTGLRHSGDADVRVPAKGFSLAASVTTPTDGERPEEGWPAVLLVPGTGLVDRDENIDGVPIFGQLAGELADAGYLVMRYDKRGVGQSGGRPESADIEVYAEDVRTMIKYLSRRDDVDDDRLIVLGHGEGGWIALQAAAKEKSIDAIVLLAVPGTPGAELVLEQQRNRLDRMQATSAERDQQIGLQTQIVDAVLGEGSWDDVPEGLRQRADTPWFRSFLEFEPADVVVRTRQPVLIAHGEVDMLIPVGHADRLAAVAETRRRNGSTVEVAKLPGLNHLLLGSPSGNVDEYTQLLDQQVAPEVIEVLDDWLSRAVPSNR